MAKPRASSRHKAMQDAVSSKIETNISELKAGALHSGSKSGPVISNTPKGRKRAIAISYSQVRRGKA